MAATADSLFRDVTDATRARLFSEISWCNPFHERRAELERDLLGRARKTTTGNDFSARTANIEKLTVACRELLDGTRPAFLSLAEKLHKQPTAEAELYQDAVFFLLFHTHLRDFQAYIDTCEKRRDAPPLTFYDDFGKALRHYLPLGLIGRYSTIEYKRVFAVFFQLRRAFHHIHSSIAGDAEPLRRLRARIWQSIFTHDMDRYQRVLCDRMGDVITLITGPSGTGKELVARAIGLSRYIPFDDKSRRFEEDYRRSFYPVNLSALTPTLIESELFGHRRGAFTGALQDRKGYFETCGPYGTVFLDEIGETGTDIQVKLLRVLQTRSFTPIGHTEAQPFSGKIMAATNRDLPAEIANGSFREDFYYRLCADQVRTPALREIFADNPAEQEYLVHYLARRFSGEEEAETVAGEVSRAIEEHLGPQYPWPGNFRELEQCVRNVLVHGEYHPALHGKASPCPAGSQLLRAIEAGSLTVNELLREYVTRAYARTESYEESARRLGLDRRTVKKYVDPDLLQSLRTTPTARD